MQQQSNASSPLPAQAKKAIIGFSLSLVSSLVILCQGILRVFRGEILDALGVTRLRIFDLLGLRWEITGAIAIVFAVLILVGAFLIRSPRKETTGGILVLIFASLSIITGGGWLVGTVLGVAGGILGLLKK